MNDELEEVEEAGQRGEIVVYQTGDGRVKLDVRLENESLWLTQAAMAELFQTSKQNISLHLRNIFDEGELEEPSVVKEYLTTAADGKNYATNFYNLDAIISVGYRVKEPDRDAFPHLGHAASARVYRKGFCDGRRAVKEPAR